MNLNTRLCVGAIACVLGVLVVADPALAVVDNAADNPQAGNVQRPARAQILNRVRQAMAQQRLTPVQRQKIRAMLTDIRAELQALRAQVQQGNRAGLLGQLRSILTDVRQQITAILTPEKKAKLQELWKQRHQRGGTAK